MEFSKQQRITVAPLSCTSLLWQQEKWRLRIELRSTTDFNSLTNQRFTQYRSWIKSLWNRAARPIAQLEIWQMPFRLPYTCSRRRYHRSLTQHFTRNPKHIDSKTNQSNSKTLEYMSLCQRQEFKQKNFQLKVAHQGHILNFPRSLVLRTMNFSFKKILQREY